MFQVLKCTLFKKLCFCSCGLLDIKVKWEIKRADILDHIVIIITDQGQIIEPEAKEVGCSYGIKDEISEAWMKNNPNSSCIFLEIACWYWPLGFSWISLHSLKIELGYSGSRIRLGFS